MAPSPTNTTAFSLVELMVVVTTIGILALMGVPGVRQAAERTEATAAANDLRVMTESVEFYSTSQGQYPDSMTSRNMPSEIASYLPAPWKDGTYSWFYVNNRSFVYIYVYDLQFTAEQALRLDSIIDDGNIATGSLLVAFNGTGLVYLFDREIT